MPFNHQTCCVFTWCRYNMLLNILRSHSMTVEGMLKHSFKQFQVRGPLLFHCMSEVDRRSTPRAPYSSPALAWRVHSCRTQQQL